MINSLLDPNAELSEKDRRKQDKREANQERKEDKRERKAEKKQLKHPDRLPKVRKIQKVCNHSQFILLKQRERLSKIVLGYLISVDCQLALGRGDKHSSQTGGGSDLINGLD